MTTQHDNDFFPEGDNNTELPIPESVNHPQNEKPKNDQADDLPTYTNETPKPKRSARNPILIACGLFMGVIMMCCILPVILIGGGLAVAGAALDEVNDEYIETLDIDDEDNVTLDININVGAVEINGRGDTDEIRVSVYREATAFNTDRAQELLDSIAVNIYRDGDRYVIESNTADDNGFMENSRVQLEIEVPETLNIVATSEVGAIDIDNVIIDNRLEVESNVGSFSFDGTIAGEGIYEIRANVGSVEMRFDDDSSFFIDVQTEVGAIDNGMDLQDVSMERNGPSNTLIGTYGEDPESTLRIFSDVGAVELKD